MVAKDYAKALECLNKAIAKGNARAMYELSQMYLRGQGVEPDFKLSKEWLYKSMEADDRIIEGFNTVKSKINAVLHSKQ
ncbi:tetratricopeptide repeat protein [Bacteroides rodentium]|uniref:tetratricopeptide repeat protein n=1 Tax=Bacteroides rodentium TaxID=691816 RepID=UPI000470072C|nr:SEL1-like repeat protein [Bacteroides rodentium]